MGTMLDSAPRPASREPIPRWVGVSLLVCLIATVAAVGVAAYAKWTTIGKISAVSFSEVPPHAVPLPSGAREEYLVLPNSSVDARWWVVHTKKMLRDGSWRVRGTMLDNAPDGREVHWSSFLMWVLGVLAWLRSWGTGGPAEWFVADAAVAAGPLLLVFLLGGLGILAQRALGWRPAIFYLLTLLTTQGVVRTFELGEADHHGIVLAFASACALCLVAGGAGFARRQDEAASHWFMASGVAGSAALWVSASTALPILAGLGAGGFLTGWVFARIKEPSPIRPDLWFVWGVAGCLGSLGFYLLEYFPRDMSWRLEVNHPLYAFAWLGGSQSQTEITRSIRLQCSHEPLDRMIRLAVLTTSIGRDEFESLWNAILGSYVLRRDSTSIGNCHRVVARSSGQLFFWSVDCDLELRFSDSDGRRGFVRKIA